MTTYVIATKKGFYFYVQQRANSRICSYNKYKMQAALLKALNEVPPQLRPTLWEYRCSYRLFVVRIHPPHIYTLNDLRHLRQLLEGAVRQVHRKAAYGFGFDTPNPLTDEVPNGQLPEGAARKSLAFSFLRPSIWDDNLAYARRALN